MLKTIIQPKAISLVINTDWPSTSELLGGGSYKCLTVWKMNLEMLGMALDLKIYANISEQKIIQRLEEYLQIWAEKI